MNTTASIFSPSQLKTDANMYIPRGPDEHPNAGSSYAHVINQLLDFIDPNILSAICTLYMKL